MTQYNPRATDKLSVMQFISMAAPHYSYCRKCVKLACRDRPSPAEIIFARQEAAIRNNAYGSSAQVIPATQHKSIFHDFIKK